MLELSAAPSVLILWVVVGYLLGSIPFGIVTAKVFGLGDLRKIGSGNTGATNVLRTGNKTAAATTLILDAAKGAAVVLLALSLAGPDAAQIAGFAACIGHCFPVWLRFRGGKGVATFLGILLGYAWPVGVAACLTWVAMAAVFRISSLAALAAALTTPGWALLLGYGEMAVLAAALCVVIFARHAANIARLWSRIEPRIGGKG